MFEELELTFISIETNIKLKRNRVNNLYTHETELLNENFNQKSLLEKYSNELNLYREGLLEQKETNLRWEIDQAMMETKERRNLEFKRGLAKSAKICIGKLIKKEFKLNKIFSISQLVKYKKYLGLEEVIQKVDESNDKNVLLEAMSLASQFGNLEIVKYLVENAADVNTKGAYCDGTALQYASINGHLEVVKYLVENGAEVNAQEEDDDDEKALLSASCRENFKIVKHLVETVVNAKEKKYGKTALIYASREGHLEIAKYLLQNGADVNAEDDWYRTALIYASCSLCKNRGALIEIGNIKKSKRTGKNNLFYS